MRRYYTTTFYAREGGGMDTGDMHFRVGGGMPWLEQGRYRWWEKVGTQLSNWSLRGAFMV